ncbi:MAG: hypothetical protein F8N36_12025 [Desulfovibrio sp.]|uniref:hypothetical protein n=1 Tax=Desulfovibrio sp. TaxID=885 RepID=UPI00135D9D83|nr:hypothetical protein [Desulfovibrio sp.]MTJ93575.1 hypothetical protein [Desulfovibrio sp.]
MRTIQTRADLAAVITQMVNQAVSLQDIGRRIMLEFDAADLVVVPIEETEDMLDAAIQAEASGDDTWAAKLQASPFVLTADK